MEFEPLLVRQREKSESNPAKGLANFLCILMCGVQPQLRHLVVEHPRICAQAVRSQERRNSVLEWSELMLPQRLDGVLAGWATR